MKQKAQFNELIGSNRHIVIYESVCWMQVKEGESLEVWSFKKGVPGC